MEKSFSGFENKHGLVCSNFAGSFESKLFGFEENKELKFDNTDSTYYGFVSSGTAIVRYNNLEYPVSEGMYFSINGGEYSIVGGRGIVIEKLNYKGVFSLGGPIGKKGHLKYIDGCTDSLLVPALKKGDPCLNALYFPSNIDQTPHVHPSDRVGMIFKGTGTCITPGGEIPLNEGDLFVIHEDGLHSFRTESDEEMIVIAFHPDSDFGPEDENHPMINRTIVNGLSASQITEIRTK
jgi:mannose-6-phosphate isomerase-like protein (cupin superfamily)